MTFQIYKKSLLGLKNAKLKLDSMISNKINEHDDENRFLETMQEVLIFKKLEDNLYKVVTQTMENYLTSRYSEKSIKQNKRMFQYIEYYIRFYNTLFMCNQDEFEQYYNRLTITFRHLVNNEFMEKCSDKCTGSLLFTKLIENKYDDEYTGICTKCKKSKYWMTFDPKLTKQELFDKLMIHTHIEDGDGYFHML